VMIMMAVVYYHGMLQCLAKQSIAYTLKTNFLFRMNL
jgi:hypothetical protein